MWADIKQIQKLAVPEELASCKLFPAYQPGWLVAGFHTRFQKPVLPRTPAERIEKRCKMAKPVKILMEPN